MRRPDFNRRGDPGRDGPRGNRRGNRGRNNENNRGSRNPGNRGANNRNPRRPTPAQQKAQQEREARRRAQELERARRRSRMDAERATRQSRRDQERRALFGSSGIPFRGDPKFTSHTMGEFRIPDLNPGLYVLDVAAPGYIKVANGPIRLVKGEKPPRLTVRIEKGRVIEGKVVDSNGAPLPNADVELLAPTGQTRPPFFSGSPLLRVMRPPNEGRRLESVRTDIQGFFSFHAQKAGSYRIRARAQRYATGLLDDLSLNTRSDLTGLVVKLVPAGRIYGKVHNLPKGERVSVAVASTKGLRRFVRVDSTSGEYSIDGLDPGDYFVRIQQGRNPMGQILASLTTPGADQPDLTLRPGASVRYDLNAAATLVGSLEGRIYLNSGPGANLEVRLAPEPTNPTANPGLQGMGGVRRVQRMLGQMLRRRTNGQGEFKIEGIPPGAYRIEIRRRGGRGRPERLLFKGPLRVNPGPATRRDFTLVLGGLDLEIVDVDKGRALPGGTVFMALASQARNLPPKEWRKLPSFQKIDFRKGRVKLREIQVGEWLYAVTGPGFQPRTGEIYIGAGDSTPPATFKLKARPKKKKPAKGKAKKKGP